LGLKVSGLTTRGNVAASEEGRRVAWVAFLWARATGGAATRAAAAATAEDGDDMHVKLAHPPHLTSLHPTLRGLYAVGAMINDTSSRW